jgi:antitoxin (DNA-binding transcriptional repressor) of toxin-antitoxin stability system
MVFRPTSWEETMHRASLADATTTLNSLLDRVRRGETILILDGQAPVARLGPVGPGDASVDGGDWMATLFRDGVLAPARKPLSAGEIPRPVRATGGVSVVAALLADREE